MMNRILIITIFILIQTFKTESNPIDSSFINNWPVSDWRKDVTIEKERKACLEICNECFSFVIIFYFNCL